MDFRSLRRKPFRITTRFPDRRSILPSLLEEQA
jgi:hypothetical protein